VLISTTLLCGVLRLHRTKGSESNIEGLDTPADSDSQELSAPAQAPTSTVNDSTAAATSPALPETLLLSLQRSSSTGSSNSKRHDSSYSFLERGAARRASLPLRASAERCLRSRSSSSGSDSSDSAATTAGTAVIAALRSRRDSGTVEAAIAALAAAQAANAVHSTAATDTAAAAAATGTGATSVGTGSASGQSPTVSGTVTPTPDAIADSCYRGLSGGNNTPARDSTDAAEQQQQAWNSSNNGIPGNNYVGTYTHCYACFMRAWSRSSISHQVCLAMTVTLSVALPCYS
jgi:hypothetical protein